MALLKSLIVHILIIGQLILDSNLKINIMKKVFVVILLSITYDSFSQEYYRDTTLERSVFNKVNQHRANVGIHEVTFNPDNTRAVPWAEILVKNDIETGGIIYHCGCAAGIEIIVLSVIGNKDSITLSVDEIASDMVTAWELSPSHKEGMEDKYMTRGFNAVYVYKSPSYDNNYVALSVYQFLRDKEYYINLDWDENKRVPNRFLSEYELVD